MLSIGGDFGLMKIKLLVRKFKEDDCKSWVEVCFCLVRIFGCVFFVVCEK